MSTDEIHTYVHKQTQGRKEITSIQSEISALSMFIIILPYTTRSDVLKATGVNYVSNFIIYNYIVKDYILQSLIFFTKKDSLASFGKLLCLVATSKLFSQKKR